MARKLNLWGLLVKEKTALTQNQLSMTNYYQWLKLLHMSMFEWKGLPETINLDYLEETLFEKGRLIFFKDDILGFLALRCVPDGSINVYGEPTSFHISVPGYQSTKKLIPGFNCVLIKNNQLSEPSMYAVGEFASRLAETERTIDINIKAQKTPFVIPVPSDKSLLTLRNAYKQIADGEPVLFLDKDMLSGLGINVLKTDAPYVVDKLDTHKMNLWNEALTFLGINNTNTEKRERLITDEVQANEQMVQMSANTMLNKRKFACEQINKLFPELSVSVEMKSFNEEGGFEDGEVYNGIGNAD